MTAFISVGLTCMICLFGTEVEVNLSPGKKMGRDPYFCLRGDLSVLT